MGIELRLLSADTGLQTRFSREFYLTIIREYFTAEHIKSFPASIRPAILKMTRIAEMSSPHSKDFYTALQYLNQAAFRIGLGSYWELDLDPAYDGFKITKEDQDRLLLKGADDDINSKDDRDSKEKNSGSTFFVYDAHNPFFALWNDGGITDATLNPEKRGRLVELQPVLEESIALYTSAGLADWTNDIKKANFSNLAPEKITLMKQFIADGWAVISVMPGREAMLRQIVLAMQRFKSVWISSGSEKIVQNSFVVPMISEGVFGALSATPNTTTSQAVGEANKQFERWVATLPEEPYVLLATNSQMAGGKTVDEQIQLVASEQARCSCLDVMHPGEYAVMSSVFPSHARGEAPKSLSKLLPTDLNTITRFPNLPVFSDGKILAAGFYKNHGCTIYGGDDGGIGRTRHGIRLSLRIPLV